MRRESELALTLLRTSRRRLKSRGPRALTTLERKEGIMNFTKTALAMGSAIGVRELLKTIEGVHLDDILGTFGLERRPSSLAQVLPAAGLIAVSAVVGAGIALLLAPTSGSKLRARLSDGIDDAKHRLSDSISQHESSPAHRHSIS
jgi:YtxH-like protein